MTRANRGKQLTDRAMLAAVILSLSVHAVGLLVLTKPQAIRTPTTDVVGDSAEVELGLDLAMVEPVVAPPVVAPEPTPPKVEPPPPPVPEVTPPPEPAPVETPRVAELPTPDSTPAAVAPVAIAPTFTIPIEAPSTLPPAPVVPSTHTTPVDPPRPVDKPAPSPVAAFAGVRADRASRVVYAVDVSGVMVGSLPFVIEELQRCVSRLGPDQEFQVILFRDPPPPARSASGENTDSTSTLTEHNPTFDGVQAASSAPLPPIADLYPSAVWVGRTKASAATQPPALLHVNETSRTSLAAMLADMQSDGASNPLTGLRLALSLKPDVVFLLTRGIRRSGTTWGPGEVQVMAALDEANPKDASGRRATTIRTIQFVGKDPSGLMDRIAKEHGGGSSTVLTVSDLKAANKAQKQTTAPRR